jgi:hypothetical protein
MFKDTCLPVRVGREPRHLIPLCLRTEVLRHTGV